MYVVIVGGGKVGASLAQNLASEGHEVAVVEFDRNKCGSLSELMDGVRVMCGDGDEPYVLEDAGVPRADAIIAATGHDEDNLVVCLLGKFEYKVPLTLARINNPKNEWLFSERFGVDVPVSQTSMISQLLRERVTAG
jgi:trk system potassium uptake protein TrkA